jgi:hypothetical protein
MFDGLYQTLRVVSLVGAVVVSSKYIVFVEMSKQISSFLSISQEEKVDVNT